MFKQKSILKGFDFCSFLYSHKNEKLGLLKQMSGQCNSLVISFVGMLSITTVCQVMN